MTLPKLGDVYHQRQLINSKSKNCAFFGIELEYEKLGVHFSRWHSRVLDADEELANRLRKYWEIKQDGSLRGEHSAEFCFAAPLPYNLAKERIDDLFKGFERIALPTTSIRTGYHVHLNVRDMTIAELQDLFILYALFEPVWYTYAAADRSGNVFCQPWWRDFAYLFTIRNMGSPMMMWQDFGKYSGLNLGPVATLGSVEFRHMPCTIAKSRIIEWLDIINLLREAAKTGAVRDCLSTAVRRSPSEALANLVGSQLFRALYYPRLDEEVYSLSLDVASCISSIEIQTKEWEKLLSDNPKVAAKRATRTVRNPTLMNDVLLTDDLFRARAEELLREQERN